MNALEALSIVTYLNRAGLLYAVEGQADVWADALADVSYPTAQEVVRDMAARRTSGGRSVTPGDVREAVRVIRSARTSVMRAPQPPQELDGDPMREQAWTRAYIRLVGDGLPEDEADARACAELEVERKPLVLGSRPVAALVSTHGKGCSCGCLTRPIARHERDERPVRRGEGA